MYDSRAWAVDTLRFFRLTICYYSRLLSPFFASVLLPVRFGNGVLLQGFRVKTVNLGLWM